MGTPPKSPPKPPATPADPHPKIAAGLDILLWALNRTMTNGSPPGTPPTMPPTAVATDANSRSDMQTKPDKAAQTKPTLLPPELREDELKGNNNPAPTLQNTPTHGSPSKPGG